MWHAGFRCYEMTVTNLEDIVLTQTCLQLKANNSGEFFFRTPMRKKIGRCFFLQCHTFSEYHIYAISPLRCSPSLYFQAPSNPQEKEEAGLQASKGEKTSPLVSPVH